MPTKVLDLDFDALPACVEYPAGYRRALVLVRFKGVPVGKFHLPLNGAGLPREKVVAAICREFGPMLADAWLTDWIGHDGRPKPQSLPSATVAVCTRDRADDLARCLESVTRLRQGGQQVMVVDSASRGAATPDVVARFPGARYVREEQPGLDRARNRALREASTEVVAFIDDDAIADPGWLSALLRNFDDSEIMCVTGLTMPLELETNSQETFEQIYPFARGFHRKVHDRWSLPPVCAGRAGAGVNMALRRDVLAKIGPFDEALDAGALTRSGGDNDMFARILSRGYRIIYDPAALNWHRHRRAPEELISQAYGYGAGVYAAFAAMWRREHDIAVFSTSLRWLLADQLPRLVRSLLKRPGSGPSSVVLAELRGCLAGPAAYAAETRRLAEGPGG